MVAAKETLTKHPIYIPSRGRSHAAVTAEVLKGNETPFKLVIEPEEETLYLERFDKTDLLILPFSNLGQGSIPARNWIKEHSIKQGAEWHWQLDDNMSGAQRYYRGRKVHCSMATALRFVEEFVSRYTNIGVAGLNYSMTRSYKRTPPFHLNAHVYSCALVWNTLPNKWRGRYNEDTDYCLQILADGYCTALINVYTVIKKATMTVGGGNTADLYIGDGRLKMARALERMWPGVVKTIRRFKRPQHFVVGAWEKFDTQLIPKKT